MSSQGVEASIKPKVMLIFRHLTVIAKKNLLNWAENIPQHPDISK